MKLLSIVYLIFLLITGVILTSQDQYSSTKVNGYFYASPTPTPTIKLPR